MIKDSPANNPVDEEDRHTASTEKSAGEVLFPQKKADTDELQRLVETFVDLVGETAAGSVPQGAWHKTIVILDNAAHHEGMADEAESPPTVNRVVNATLLRDLGIKTFTAQSNAAYAGLRIRQIHQPRTCYPTRGRASRTVFSRYKRSMFARVTASRSLPQLR